MRSRIEWVDIETGECTVVAEFPDVVEAPNWTLDGQALIYNQGGRLFRLDLTTGSRAQVDTGYAIRCNNDHVLHPRGREIALSHHSAEDGLSRIYRVPIEGGVPQLVTSQGPSYLHGWSPDGLRLAYCAERNGQFDIYTIGVDGGPEQQLTNVAGLDDGPEYTPDGEFLWFNSERTGSMQLWRMSVHGQQAEPMTKDEAWHNWFPHISPDGQWVAFLSYHSDHVAAGDHPPDKEVAIRLMPASGGSPRTLLTLFGGQGTLNVNSWDPHGRRVAFVRYFPAGSSSRE